MVDGDWRVPGRQIAPVISENSHRTPFTGENKFRPPVRVEVRKYSAADQANSSDDAAGRAIELQPTTVVAEQSRRCRLRIPSGDHAPADKKVQVAITVDICERQRSSAGHGLQQVFIEL